MPLDLSSTFAEPHIHFKVLVSPIDGVTVKVLLVNVVLL